MKLSTFKNKLLLCTLALGVATQGLSMDNPMDIEDAAKNAARKPSALQKKQSANPAGKSSAAKGKWGKAFKKATTLVKVTQALDGIAKDAGLNRDMSALGLSQGD